MAENTNTTTNKIFTEGLYANEKSGKHGAFLNVDIKVVDFVKFLEKNTNDQGYCKITLYKNKQGSASKNSHYGVINDFKPEPKPPQGQMQEQVVADSSDLPF